MPLAALVLVRWMDLNPVAAAIVVAYAALPTAPSAYILASRMGGDGPLVAALISLSLIGSAFALGQLRSTFATAGKLEKAHAVAHAIYLETQRLTQAIQDHRRIALEGSKHSEREAHSALTMLNMRYLAAASAALEDAQREVREAASKL